MIHLEEMRKTVISDYTSLCSNYEPMYIYDFDYDWSEYLSGDVPHQYSEYDDEDAYYYIRESFSIFNIALHNLGASKDCIRKSSILGEAYYNSLDNRECTDLVKYLKSVLRLIGQYTITLPMLVYQAFPFINECIRSIQFEIKFEQKKKEMRK